MSARYWVLASDELMDTDPQWPDGLRPIEAAEAPSAKHPGMRWWKFEDDDASETLNGKCVELSIQGHYDEHGNLARSEITARSVTGGD